MFTGNDHFALPASLLPSSPSPDQPADILSYYIQQATMGTGLLPHIITYKCAGQVPPVST